MGDRQHHIREVSTGNGDVFDDAALMFMVEKQLLKEGRENLMEKYGGKYTFGHALTIFYSSRPAGDARGDHKDERSHSRQFPSQS